MRFTKSSDIQEENLYRAVMDRAIRDVLFCIKIDTTKAPVKQDIDMDDIAEAVDALCWFHPNSELAFISDMAGMEQSVAISRADACVKAQSGQPLKQLQNDVLRWAAKHIRQIPPPASVWRIRECLRAISS